MDSQESARQTLSQNYGLVTEISPRDLPWGAFTTLTNLQDVVPGEMRTRKGLAPASNFTDASPTAYDIQSIEAFPSPLGPTVVTVDSNGVWRARRGGTTYSIATGLGTSVPWRFCRTRDGQLIAVNGLQRGKIWRGSNAAAVALGVDPPTAAIASADAPLGSGGGLSEGTYLIAQRFVDDANLRTDPVYSELGPVLSKTATDGQKLTYDSSDLEDPTGRGTKRQIWRTTVAQSTVFYYVLVQNVTETVDPDDTLTDQALIDAAAEDPTKRLVIRGPYGIVARRFGVPPKHKGVVVQHRDRYFYAVDVPYDTGTVSIASGDPTLTGSGTAWTADFVGRWVWIEGASKPYVISTFTDATHVELNANGAETLNGKAYKILPDPAERNQVYYSAIDEPESVHSTFTFTVQAAQEDDDELTALLPFGSVLYCLKNRHTYAFTFSKEPGYDGRASYAFARGCLNQATWDVLDGKAYVMDATGAYAFAPGGGPESISDAIQGRWRDGTIDLSGAKWFHVQADPSSKVVRFFVKYSGDSGTRPTRALCYHTIYQSWWDEAWTTEIGGCALVEESGVVKTVVGASHDRCYYLNSGELDGISAEKSGTATAGTSSTLTNSSGAFGSSSECVGASVVIYDGTGVGQQRRITSHTSTTLTVSPNWTTTPDTTSKYVVGGYAYKAKTGFTDLIAQAKGESENTMFSMTVEPITDDRPMRVRRYWNFDDTAETRPDGGSSPDKLVSWQAGSTDLLVKIHASARNEGTNQGDFTLGAVQRVPSSRVQTKRHLAIEIEGGKGDEAVIIHELAQSGTGKGQ